MHRRGGVGGRDFTPGRGPALTAKKRSKNAQGAGSRTLGEPCGGYNEGTA